MSRVFGRYGTHDLIEELARLEYRISDRDVVSALFRLDIPSLSP